MGFIGIDSLRSQKFITFCDLENECRGKHHATQPACNLILDIKIDRLHAIPLRNRMCVKPCDSYRRISKSMSLKNTYIIQLLPLIEGDMTICSPEACNITC